MKLVKDDIKEGYLRTFTNKRISRDSTEVISLLTNSEKVLMLIERYTDFIVNEGDAERVAVETNQLLIETSRK